MNQERLELLAELLAEARQALPEGEFFEVSKRKGVLLLNAERIYVTSGSWDSYVLKPNGEVEHKNGFIY